MPCQSVPGCRSCWAAASMACRTDAHAPLPSTSCLRGGAGEAGWAGAQPRESHQHPYRAAMVAMCFHKRAHAGRTQPRHSSAAAGAAGLQWLCPAYAEHAHRTQPAPHLQAATRATSAANRSSSPTGTPALRGRLRGSPLPLVEGCAQPGRSMPAAACDVAAGGAAGAGRAAACSLAPAPGGWLLGRRGLPLPPTTIHSSSGCMLVSRKALFEHKNKGPVLAAMHY